jgi:putative spermidine/putrescine transport system substrate-binding protein
MLRFSLAYIIFAGTLPATAQDLTIVSWGGAYEAAQQAAIIGPFAKATATNTETLQYGGMTEEIARRSEAEGWDVIDMLADQARIACNSGLIKPLDPAELLGREALADFSPVKPMRCAIPQNVYARVIAYDERAFPGVKPSRLNDFFDTERFPGPRAVQQSPDGILEWALMAEGVPPEQIYALLSTDRGLRLAMRRLETIRDDIVWWTDPGEPAELLADGRAVLAAGYNGRFFDAARRQRLPINIIWDGRIVGVEVWAIASSSDASDTARAFLAHALGPDAMARLSERIPYGPTRLSAFERIGQNPETGVQMRDHLPNAPGRGDRALVRDDTWYSNTDNLRTRRFDDWLSERR